MAGKKLRRIPGNIIFCIGGSKLGPWEFRLPKRITPPNRTNLNFRKKAFNSLKTGLVLCLRTIAMSVMDSTSARAIFSLNHVKTPCLGANQERPPLFREMQKRAFSLKRSGTRIPICKCRLNENLRKRKLQIWNNGSPWEPPGPIRLIWLPSNQERNWHSSIMSRRKSFSRVQAMSPRSGLLPNGKMESARMSPA